MNVLLWYRGFRIYREPPSIPIGSFDWHFLHPEYDAEQFSDGSVRDNGLCGDGASPEDCMAQIDEKLAERDELPDLCHRCGGHDGEYTLPDGVLLCGECADREANPDKYPEEEEPFLLESYDRWMED